VPTEQSSVAQFGADLSNLGDAAITVVASGFLTPGNNSNGPAFGLFVATATGGSLLELPSEALPTSVSEFGSTNIRTYPNPVQSNLYIDGLSVKASVKIFDMSGKLLVKKQNVSKEIDVENLTKGVYFIQINDNNAVITRKFIKE
jgi:hypothetical protein